MKLKIKGTFLLLCAGVALALLPVFVSRSRPIVVELPNLGSELQAGKPTATAEETAPVAQATAPVAAASAPVSHTPRVNKLAVCEADEDCIIVDKDPCGCLIGPKGVTSINALYTLEFDQRNANMITKACPNTAPSTERECSESARAVCRNRQCKIVYEE